MRQVIEQDLRRRIQSGVYPPGSRMPSRRILQRELGGSPLTLQAAFDRLTLQGYIVPRGSRGTFVSEHLPGQSTIALVFNDELEHGSWNRFWSALHRVAAGWHGTAAAPGRFRAYCLAGGRPEGQTYRQLCTDLADGALAGVLFTSPPLFAGPTPLFATTLPRLVISGAPLDYYPFAASHLHVTDLPVLTGLFRRFRAAGRTRVAGLAGNQENLERVRTLAEANGLEARAEWWHWLPTDPFGAAAAQRLVHLLGSLTPRQRPDCLLIADDNLVTPATSGVLDAGWQAPREVEIAAHANFPLITRAAVPCLRYGLDAAVLLQAAAEEIGRLAAGGEPQVVEVPLTAPGM
jgi:hypothetical protein